MKKLLSYEPRIFSRYLWLAALVPLAALFLGGRADRVEAGTGSGPSPAPAASVPMLAGTIRPVSVSPGNQTNPRVDCDKVTYTYDDLEGSSTIHYFDLATGVDTVIPTDGYARLSDVQGGRVAFTELGASGDQIVIYDTTSRTRSVVAGVGQFYPRIGGNTMAFALRDLGPLPGPDGVVVYDMTTGGRINITSFDELPDRHPAISPSGGEIVWETCQPDFTLCHIHSVTSNSTQYFGHVLTSGASNEQFPQTDGRIVTYISDKSGENDIYYQPVGGGTETRIAIPGDQREPTISGGLLAFESNQTGQYEVYVYDLRSGRLYQVTTPQNGGEKSLNHISVCGGQGRIVYTVPGTFGDFDVYAFTFQVPSSVPGQVNDLISLVRGFSLPDGPENSFVVKLRAVLAAIDAGDNGGACSALDSFISEAYAQSGKKLTGPQAEQLINSARQIGSALGCH